MISSNNTAHWIKLLAISLMIIIMIKSHCSINLLTEVQSNRVLQIVMKVQYHKHVFFKLSVLSLHHLKHKFIGCLVTVMHISH